MTKRDEELLDQLAEVSRRMNVDESRAIGLIAKILELRSYAVRGYSSMFKYCTEFENWSDSTANRRIAIANAIPRFPQMSAMIEDGRLNLTAAAMVAPRLTVENAEELLRRATRLSSRQLEVLLAEMSQKPVAPKKDRVRIIPGARDGEKKPVAAVQEESPLFNKVPPALDVDAEAAAGAAAVAVAEPIAAAVVAKAEIRFTCPAAMLELIERAKDVLAHSHPRAQLADVFAAALNALIAAKTPQAPTRNVAQRPTTSPRHIPAAVRRAVYARDNGCCTYVSKDGHRCGSRRALQIDHILEFALGGRSDDVDNLRLLCRAHNLWRAQQTFGRRHYPLRTGTGPCSPPAGRCRSGA